MQLGLGNSLVMRNRPSGSSAPTVAPVLLAYPSDYVVNLNWSHSDMTDSPGFGYSVYRRVDGGSWDFRGDTSDDFWVENPSNYIEEGFFEFKVVPFNNFGTGPDSNIADVTLVWVDPLAGYTFVLRLQTHRGDGVPYGLFQDAAGTVPATSDGHPVGCWKDLISGSGLAAVQANAPKRPTLRFSSGLPFVSFDGVDDMTVVTGFVASEVSTILTRMLLTKETFCKPWSHPSVQHVSSYVNDDAVHFMSGSMNGPQWNVDALNTATHHCYYNGAGSYRYVNGDNLATGNPGSGTPLGSLTLSDTTGGVPAATMDMSFFAVSAGQLAEPATLHAYLESLQP